MIPKFKEYFYPFLSSIEIEGKRIATIRSEIAAFFQLSDKDLSELTKGGNLKHFDRTAWAATYLRKMGLIKRDGLIYTITPSGKDILQKYGDSFSLAILRDMKGFESTQRKTDSDKSHWVEGHYRPDGTYVAGYASNFFAQGIRKKK